MSNDFLWTWKVPYFLVTPLWLYFYVCLGNPYSINAYEENYGTFLSLKENHNVCSFIACRANVWLSTVLWEIGLLTNSTITHHILGMLLYVRQPNLAQSSLIQIKLKYNTKILKCAAIVCIVNIAYNIFDIKLPNVPKLSTGWSVGMVKPAKLNILITKNSSQSYHITLFCKRQFTKTEMLHSLNIFLHLQGNKVIEI